jgi:hypothetical protein
MKSWWANLNPFSRSKVFLDSPAKHVPFEPWTINLPDGFYKNRVVTPRVAFLISLLDEIDVKTPDCSI